LLACVLPPSSIDRFQQSPIPTQTQAPPPSPALLLARLCTSAACQSAEASTCSECTATFFQDPPSRTPKVSIQTRNISLCDDHTPTPEAPVPVPIPIPIPSERYSYQAELVDKRFQMRSTLPFRIEHSVLVPAQQGGLSYNFLSSGPYEGT
jgi:hypothetical protein